MSTSYDETNELEDGDYILADKAGWFEVGGLAVRLAYQNGTLAIGVYESGNEGDDPVFATEIEDEFCKGEIK